MSQQVVFFFSAVCVIESMFTLMFYEYCYRRFANKSSHVTASVLKFIGKLSHDEEVIHNKPYIIL